VSLRTVQDDRRNADRRSEPSAGRVGVEPRYAELLALGLVIRNDVVHFDRGVEPTLEIHDQGGTARLRYQSAWEKIDTALRLK